MTIKNIRYVAAVMLPLHLGVIAMPFLTTVSWLHLFYFVLGYVFLHGLGVNVGLHRWAAHRAIELNTVAKPVVVICSILAAQGHPLWWAAVHRGSHHRYSDQERDEHSPRHGFWTAFVGWIFNHDPTKVNYKAAVDLMRDPMITKSVPYYEAMIWTTWILMGLTNYHMLLWMLILPAFAALHTEGLVNSLCHSDFGYRNHETKDRSRNIPILGLLGWGNGWHNNHHYRAADYDFGGERWYEYDPCRLFIPFIKRNAD